MAGFVVSATRNAAATGSRLTLPALILLEIPRSDGTGGDLLLWIVCEQRGK
jgi:hypothetical protein